MLALAAIAIAAIVTGIRVGSTSEPAPTGLTPQPTETAPVDTGTTETIPEDLPSLLPLPGPVREEGGLVWWTSTSCGVGSVDVSSGSVVEIRTEHCRSWPSPSGADVIAVSDRRAEALAGRGLVLLEDRGRSESVVEHTPGILSSEIAWNAEGGTFAACFGTRDGNTVDVITPGGEPRLIAGECFPAWLPDGRLATVAGPPRTITIDGRPLPSAAGLARLVPEPKGDERVAVSAMAGAPHGLVVALTIVSPTRLFPAAATLAVVGEGGRIEFSIRLPERAFPIAVGAAPDGSAVWYVDASTGRASVFRLPSGEPLAVLAADWVTWSPSARFMAAATDVGIVIHAWPSGQEIAEIPVDAVDVTWTRKP